MSIKRYTYYLLIVICSLYGVSLHAQNETKPSIKESKKLKKQIEKGDSYFARGPLFFQLALETYASAATEFPDAILPRYKMGVIHAQIRGDQDLPKEYLESSLSKGLTEPQLMYHLGKAYQEERNLDTALQAYSVYQLYLEKDTSLSVKEKDAESARVKKRIKECTHGIEFINKPIRVFIDTLNANINSKHDDYASFISSDEQQIIYTSRQPITKGGEIADFDADYYEDIYISRKNGDWGPAESLPGRINKKTNDAIIGLSIDGQKMFIYRDNNNGDIYLSKLKKTTWSVPKKMKALNTEYHESSACFSSDLNTIYFISDRPGGYGGKDVYKSTRIKGNKWNEPENLGPNVNTPYDETTPYIHPSGTDLYFSSKGHNSMGGYDIFKAKNSNWTSIENIGYPINDVGDDISFIPSMNYKTALYSSSRNHRTTKDIYQVEFMGAEKEGIMNTMDNLLSNQTEAIKNRIIEPKVIVQKNGLTILKGVVRDAVTRDFLEASIEIVDNKKKEVVSIFNSNGETGKYLISLTSGRNYGISVRLEGYMFHSENIVIPASANYQVINQDIDLNMVLVGSKIILKNIFFDTDKAVLKDESFVELERLKDLLLKFKNAQVEISGHTDNVGSEEYNEKLSLERAQSVINYLVENGIEKERLVEAGYGFQQPIESNDTKEGRDQNRRTEFKIIDTNFKSKDPPKKNKNKGKEKNSGIKKLKTI